MRMAHRAGLLIPNNCMYLFNGGVINGITWTGGAQGFSSYEISTVIGCRAYIWNGETGTGSASVIAYADLRDFSQLHFRVTAQKTVAGTAPNIRVYPNYVSLQSSAPYEAVYDLSAIPDLSNVMIMIQSGHITKSTTSGVIDAQISVSQVWATR